MRMEREKPPRTSLLAAYHSADNAHGEQKELDLGAFSTPGVCRLKTRQLVAPISTLYREVWAPWETRPV